MFVAYRKIKIKPLNAGKVKLRMRKYFVDFHICFKKRIWKWKNVYFIKAKFDRGKNWIFKHEKIIFFFYLYAGLNYNH